MDKNDEMEKESKNGLWQICKSYLPYVIIGIVLSLGIRLVISPSVVVGESMEGSLHDGDYLLVYKLAYTKKSPPAYGDVVIVDSNEIDGDALFIKRVVGKSGDFVEIKDGDLYRNGEYIVEKYAMEKMESENMSVTIPEGEIFLLGDNRNNSLDSRVIGSLNIKEEVIGKVITRLMPFDQSYVVK